MTAAKKVEAKEYRLPQLNGSLLASLAWEDHYRSNNWLAIIDVDGTCPGGLSRRFMPRGKGESLYLIEQLGLFDAVEFAGDYMTSVGRKKPKRVYGVVVAITELAVVVREFPSGAEACVASKIARTSSADKKRALEMARDALLEKAAAAQDEIDALEGVTP